jgi:hypothetical protein
MSNLIYNATQPSSLKAEYGENDILDFIVKLPQGRSINAGSFRLSGSLAVTCNRVGDAAIRVADHIHMDAFAGIHSVIRSINTQVNNSSIENTQGYNRIVAMKRQATENLESLNTSSTLLSELCGTTANFQMVGGETSFSMLPMISLNQSSGNLSSDKFQVIQISMTLANAVEAFYTDRLVTEEYMTAADTKFTEIYYSLKDLQLEWTEMMMPSGASEPVIMPVSHLYQQSINNQSSYLNITTPVMYNSVSASFIKQSQRNSIFHNNLLCERILGLDGAGGSLEIMINSSDTPIPYAIQTYQETALNYLKSLNGNIAQNSIVNAKLNSEFTFGIGFSLMTSSNDRVALALKIDNTAYDGGLIPAYDAFLYVNSFITM